MIIRFYYIPINFPRHVSNSFKTMYSSSFVFTITKDVNLYIFDN